jgi:hypothetical protein
MVLWSVVMSAWIFSTTRIIVDIVDSTALKRSDQVPCVQIIILI